MRFGRHFKTTDMATNYTTGGRFPEMYITFEGTPFVNCPALLVIITILVVTGCILPPLYVYRRKLYYKLVMVAYRRRKDKLAKKLKKSMTIHEEIISPLHTDDSGSDDADSLCLICMDSLSDVTSSELVILLDVCSHRFHFRCILKWLDMSDGCPICRKTVDVNDRKAMRLVHVRVRSRDVSENNPAGDGASSPTAAEELGQNPADGGTSDDSPGVACVSCIKTPSVGCTSCFAGDSKMCEPIEVHTSCRHTQLNPPCCSHGNVSQTCLDCTNASTSDPPEGGDTCKYTTVHIEQHRRQSSLEHKPGDQQPGAGTPRRNNDLKHPSEQEKIRNVQSTTTVAPAAESRAKNNSSAASCRFDDDVSVTIPETMKAPLKSKGKSESKTASAIVMEEEASDVSMGSVLTFSSENYSGAYRLDATEVDV